MPRRARQLAESGIYHVMLRGVNRDAIFLEGADQERFLDFLARTQELSRCIVLAYCLMTNHVHLVLRTTDERIGEVVKRLGVRYAAWFNRKYGRVGHLFQDRFKSVAVDTDAHLLVLVRYVWNNPVEAGLVSRAEEYRWSSRRFFDNGAGLADASSLRGLLPPDALSELPIPAAPRIEDLMLARTTATDRPTDEEVAHLLERICGASTAEFVRLDRGMQRHTVRELRTRSIAYAQIARTTGMNASAIRRLHVDRRRETTPSEETLAGRY